MTVRLKIKRQRRKAVKQYTEPDYTWQEHVAGVAGWLALGALCLIAWLALVWSG